jgi:hypothetical protein
MPADVPIVLETLSVEPRIFKLKHFFTEEEADAMVTSALELRTENGELGLQRWECMMFLCYFSLFL